MNVTKPVKIIIIITNNDDNDNNNNQSTSLINHKYNKELKKITRIAKTQKREDMTKREPWMMLICLLTKRNT